MKPQAKKQGFLATCLCLGVACALILAVPFLGSRTSQAPTSPPSSTASSPSRQASPGVPVHQAQSVTTHPSSTVSLTSPSETAHHKIIFPTQQAFNSGVRNPQSKSADISKPDPVSQLVYHGGMSGVGVTTGPPKVYLVFWGSQWGAMSTDANGYATFNGDPKGVAPLLQAMFKGLGTNNESWSNVMTQYCDNVRIGSTSCPASNISHVGYPTGGALAGVWYDNSAMAPTNAGDFDIYTKAIQAAQHFGNTTPAQNRNAQYVVVSPTRTHPGGYNTPAGGFCAWHDGGFPSKSNAIAYTNLPYIPDAGQSCGANYVNSGANSDLDGVTMVESHEYAETVTDQIPGGGWTTGSYPYLENGDLCSWVGVGGATGAQNIALSTGSFVMQSTWSNATSSCAVSAPLIRGPNVVSLATPPNQVGYAQVPFSLQLAASNSWAVPMRYQASGLPTGLSLGPTTGLLSGTPTTVGVHQVTVTAMTAGGENATKQFSLTVQPSLVTVTPLSAQTVRLGSQLSLQVNATDSVQSQLTYLATGLPAGVTLNSATGSIVGTPTVSGNFTVKVTVTDGFQMFSSTSFLLTVLAAPPGLLNLKATAGTSQITVNWNVASSVGQSLSYRVSVTPGGSSCSTASSSCTITGLTPGTSYLISVVVINATWAGPATTLNVATARTSTLGVNVPLSTYQSLTSSDGRYATVMQGDGNLVTYGPSGSTWSSRTSGRGGAYLILQDDGNLVMHNAYGGVVWSSGSRSTHPNSLTQQSDGNLVARNTNSQPIWSSLTGPLNEHP